MIKYFLPYDIYERHKKVGKLIGKNDSVLDVGGELNQLANFCKPKKIVVVNLEKSREKSDIVIKKGKLPFGGGSFSTVCAIDVLEHIPPKNRQAFIDDLLRVAQKKVILSFPLGTRNHLIYEKQLANMLKSKGIDVTYLNQHLKFGLPSLADIKSYIRGKRSSQDFSGDLKITAILFGIFLFDPQIKFIGKLIYALKLAFNFLTNPIFYLALSNQKFSDKVVRAYVTIHKD